MHKESHFFKVFFPVLRIFRSLGLKILKRFCTFFMNVAKVFVR